MSTNKWCIKQTANLLSLGTHVCRHQDATLYVRRSLALIISSRDCREADSRDTSPRHACLGEVSRKIWLHDFAINNNGGSVPVIFISLFFTHRHYTNFSKTRFACLRGISRGKYIHISGGGGSIVLLRGGGLRKNGLFRMKKPHSNQSKQSKHKPLLC